MFSTTTSVSSSRASSRARSPSEPRSIAMDRFPRLRVRKLALSPSLKTGPWCRYTSPDPGRSIFSTSAPRSASTCVQ
jgi:hypothetical protein